MAPAAWRLLILTLGVTDVDGYNAYKSPETGNTLRICACAKCGTSSLYQSMFFALTNEWYPPRKGPPYVQKVKQWREQPACAQSAACRAFTAEYSPIVAEAGDLYLWITRDPLERYASAFHSKYACCDDKHRRSCYKDVRDHPAPGLFRQAGLGHAHTCMYWDEYVRALTAVHRLRKQARLDDHVRPQTYVCKPPPGGAALLVDTASVGDTMHSLLGFGPALRNYPRDVHIHPSPRNSSYNLTDLCAVARPEYLALGRRMPDACGDDATIPEASSGRGVVATDAPTRPPRGVDAPAASTRPPRGVVARLAATGVTDPTGASDES